MIAALKEAELTGNVIVITGRIGAGKTIYMSYLAKEIAEEIGAKLYSNYALHGSEQIENTTERAVIAIDEAQNCDIDFRAIEGKVIILATCNARNVYVPEGSLVIEVRKHEDKIYALSIGDVIKIDDYKDLYDAFQAAHFNWKSWELKC